MAQTHPEDDRDQMLGAGEGRNTPAKTDDNLPQLRNQERHRGRARCLQAKPSLACTQHLQVDFQMQKDMDHFHKRCELILHSKAVGAVEVCLHQNPGSSISRRANSISYVHVKSREKRPGITFHPSYQCSDVRDRSRRVEVGARGSLLVAAAALRAPG